MTIKQLGGIFGRNPTFNDVTIEGSAKIDANYPVGTDNVAIGESALGGSSLTGSQNTAVGKLSLRVNAGGSQNTAIGYSSLYNNNSGNNNDAHGRDALYANTSGSNNSAFGRLALSSNNTGFNSVAFGYEALKISTGGSNSAFGRGAGSTVTSGSNLTLLGYDAEPSSATATNEITLGNSSVSTLRCNTQTISSLSDARDKSEITPIQNSLNLISHLKPVSFIWDQRDGNRVGEKDVGFIAQELLEAQKQSDVNIPGLVSQLNPAKLEASYAKLIPVLVGAIQELQSEIDKLRG